jgi:hypothetical protein
MSDYSCSTGYIFFLSLFEFFAYNLCFLQSALITLAKDRTIHARQNMISTKQHIRSAYSVQGTIARLRSYTYSEKATTNA